jgi:hypothetical protein
LGHLNIANKQDGFLPKGEFSKSGENNSDNGDKTQTIDEGTTNAESVNYKEKRRERKLNRKDEQNQQNTNIKSEDNKLINNI